MSRYSWISDELWKYRGGFLEAVLAGFAVNVIQIMSSLFVMAVYNKILPNSALNSLFALCGGMILLLVFEFLFKLIKGEILDSICEQVEESLSEVLYEKIITWDLDTSPSQSGEISSYPRDLSTLVEMFANNNLTVLINFPFIFISLGVIYIIGGAIIFVPFFIIFILIVSGAYYFQRNVKVANNFKEFSVRKNGFFVETVSNLELLKSIGSYEFFKNRWTEACNDERLAVNQLRRLSRWQTSIQGSGLSFSQIIVVGVGAILVISESMNSGALIAAVMLTSRALQPVLQLSGVVQKISAARVSLQRLDLLFSAESNEEMRRKNAAHYSDSTVLKLSRVKYKPPGSSLPSLDVEKLVIPHGEKVGVVGSIGSGKSTLLRVLAGVLTPEEGIVSIGGKHYGSVRQDYLRDQIGYVGQFPNTFAGTIAENLLVGAPSVSDEKLENILKVTGLATVLEKIPDGMNFSLSERGRELSGGQRQILGLARILLADHSVLLLDEPTSAMDPSLENRFVGQLGGFSERKTLIVVTHRKPILQLVDRILVVEGGKIVLDGSRDHVLSKFS